MKAAKNAINTQTSTERLHKLLVAPIMTYAIVFCIVPLVYSLGISFTSYSLASFQPMEFVGFDNYWNQLTGEFSFFWQSLGLTVTFMVITVTFEFVLGFFLAQVLSRNIKGKGIFRSILILPLAVAPSVVALIFRYMLNDDYGVINHITRVLLDFKIPWLIEETAAMMAVCLADIWQYTSFCFLILFAGLLSLPKEPYEAAMLDGAGKMMVFKRITIPLMKPVISVVLLFRIVDAFNSFDKVYVLTRGGPNQATETLGMHIYKVGLNTFNIAQSAAISWMVLIILMFISKYLLTSFLKSSGEEKGLK